MIKPVWGSTDKPLACKALASQLAGAAQFDGLLYIGYPILGTPEGSFPLDALLVSPTLGVVIFDVVEGKGLSNYIERQDGAFSKMQSKLLQHQGLIKNRRLVPPINTVTFAPAMPAQALPLDGERPICRTDSLLGHLETIEIPPFAEYSQLLSVVQAIFTLRRGRKKRLLQKMESRGAKTKKLEDSIANLDSRQSEAVVETYDGVQRIRGLAGSGKTIVLALKVAYLHARHPEWLIAVTFHTRSLKGQFERLITTFVLEQTNQEPDWDNVRILNAWGAPGGGERSGIYYEFCQDHGVEYFDFRAASRFGDERQFEGACGFALQNATSLVPKYDAILVDEAQDLPPTFLTLCYEYLKSPKRLVYAYDELQSLGRPPLPPVEELFGKDIDGKPRVVIQPDQPGKPKQDIILDTCYRNSRPVLSTAHALGFGVYRQEGLAQIFENKSLWLDIGYSVVAGDLDDGMHVSLARTQQSSPEFLEKHSPLDDLIRFKVFDSAEEQTKWLVKQINLNINQDELLPDDIVVINTDPLSTRSAVSTARASLLEKGINSVLAGVSTSPDVFSEPGQVTFTGIFRAKGNEAAMVYIINAQDCYTAPQRRQVARIRSRLFTAITRSKAWVRVLGIGPEMTSLKSEFEAIAAANFELRFKYPTIDERKKMMIVNRELSKSAEERVNKKRASLIEAVASLESGETFLEDYPEEIIRRLQNIIDKKLR